MSVFTCEHHHLNIPPLCSISYHYSTTLLLLYKIKNIKKEEKSRFLSAFLTFLPQRDFSSNFDLFF
jgi:hypothetical protein